MRSFQVLLLSLLVSFPLQAESAIGSFFEPQAPFISSSLIIKEGEKTNLVRRGILVPLANHRWACFDTDLLRWAAVWDAPDAQAPLTLDSMAAISYPKGKTKATRPPHLRGDPIFTTPELPGAGPTSSRLPDHRPKLRAGGKGRIGPFPIEHGRWLGLELRDDKPVFNYQIADALISDTFPKTSEENLQRILEISPHQRTIHFRLGDTFKHLDGTGAVIKDSLLLLKPSKETRTIVIGTQAAIPEPFPKKEPAIPIFPASTVVTNPPATTQGFYKIRPLAVPKTARFIRPTDIAFLSDGAGLLTTLDGDVWRIETPEASTSKWTRVASGLFETISLEVTPEDRVFTLGRDQITELIDTNSDGHFDIYRNASNAFQQTLQTRDYATSLAIGGDGSFYIAKGGINNNKAKKDNELSLHRGAVLKISPDGDTIQVLADGLRLPYVGLCSDDSVFASDQQGNHVPSTPIHLVKANATLGYEPTNHRDLETSEPLLWYPYQANRSAAAFTNWNDTFLQVSWGGRLFAIETPASGQPFSWQLPLQLDFPSLNATRHPKSGSLFVTGLGISGYKPTTPNLSGLAFIEELSPLPKPISLEVRPTQIALTFDRPLTNEETILPASPALRLFNIQRTSKYGSGHFRWDGQPGEHRLQPKSFAISSDRRTFTLAFDRLYRADVFDLQLTLSSGTITAPLHLFTRPAHLPKADLATVAAREKAEAPLQPGNPARGRPLFTSFACAGCHSLDGAQLVGPTLKNIAARADEKSLRQSILDPAAIVTEGFEPSMPSFAGVLSNQQLADLLAYLKTLR
jgi:cytochrome c2